MSLNGHTGTITQVWRVRALVRIKQLDADVAFGIGVVTLQDGSRPNSLLDLFKEGSTIHYNAEPDRETEHGYRITKVWPAGGSKQASSTSSSTSSISGATSAEKFLKSQLKAMLLANSNRPMQLQRMHTLCAASKPCNTHVYKNTVDGLRSFILERPNHFCLLNSTVTLIEKAKDTAKSVCAPASDKVLKRQLKVMLEENPGPLQLDQIHTHLQRSKPNVVAAYKGTVNGLKSFVLARPTVFRLDGLTVSLASDVASAGPPSQPDDFGIEKTVAHLRKLVASRSHTNLESLMNLLMGCDPEIRAHVGYDTVELRQFLQSQNEIFCVTPQGLITLYDVNIREVRKAMDGGGPPHHKPNPAPSPKPRKVSTTTSTSNHPDNGPARPARPVPITSKSPKGTHMNSLNFIRDILKANGPLPASKLIGHFSHATLDIRDYVGGGTAPALLNFVQQQPDVFVVNQRGVCSVQDGQAGDGGAPWASEVLAKRDGLIQHTVKGVCGFIQNGQYNHDNIYFKPAMVVKDFDTFDAAGTGRLGVGLGDSVDCLYELHLSKSCKYRALAVWPASSAEAFAGADSAIFLKPVAVIDAPVLHGQGEVDLLMEGMGIVMVRSSGKPDKMIIFHMQHVGYEPQSSWDILAEGSQVLYVAVYQYTKKAPDTTTTKPRGNPTEVWHAIHLWPMSLYGITDCSNLTESWQGEAVVRELTCDGGSLSFGKDPWSERVSFTWRDLAARRDANRGPQLITPGEILIGAARASPALTDIKWVATDIFSRGEPQATKRMNGLQRMEPIQPQVRRSSSFGIGALSDFLSGVTVTDRRESVTRDTPSSSSSLRSVDKNLLDLLTDDVDGCTFVGGNKELSNGPEYTTTTMNMTTPQLSSIVDDNSFSKEAVDASADHMSNKCDGSEPVGRDRIVRRIMEISKGSQPITTTTTTKDKDKTTSQLSSILDDNSFIKEALDASADHMSKRCDGEPEGRARIVDGSGKVVATSMYGGVLESSVRNALVYFGAHAFYLDQSAVAHTAFQEGTKVQFDADYAGNDNFLASVVWIGKKPVRS